MPPKGKRAVKAKRSQGQPGPGKSKSDERRTKRKPEREQDTQPVKKKKRVRSSEEMPSERVVMTSGQRAKWQQLPESSRAYLESVMHGLILSIAYDNPLEQRKIQKFLNCLKERLLKGFEILRVPVEKQISLKNVKKLKAEEEEKIAVIETGLVELQETIDKSVEEVKLRHEETMCLQSEMEALKRELTAEEEMMRELFKTESNAPRTSKLQKESLEAPVLQELILKKIPNQEGVLRDLNKIQQSKEMKAMLDSLEEAYKNVG